MGVTRAASISSVLPARERFRRVVGGAAGNQVNLIISGASLAMAMILGSWCLLVMAALVYVGFIGLTLASPAAWREVCAGRPRLTLPEPADLVDPFLRSTVTGLRLSCNEAARVIAETPPEFQPRLNALLPSLQDLESCAALLIRRLAGTHSYQATMRREIVEGELRRLGGVMQQTSDTQVLREYADAMRLREQQLAALDDIARVRARATARLGKVVAIVESLPARIMRMRVLDEEAREDLCCELLGTLDRTDRELCGVEDALALAGEAGDLSAAPAALVLSA